MVYNLVFELDADGEYPGTPEQTRGSSRQSSSISSSRSPHSMPPFERPPMESPRPAEPDRGRRLLPAMIDKLAFSDPDRSWASLPYDDSDLSKGYEDISYARLADAINKLSWLIALAIGTSSNFDTIAYFGLADVRYAMMQMAACKTGYKVLFSSALNTPDTHISLLQQLECRAVFSASVVDISYLLERHPALSIVVPELDDLLNEADGTQHFPYTKTFEEAQFDPYVVLHTSGTTGTPKPIVCNHAMDAALDSHALLPDVEGRPHTLDYISLKPGQRTLVPTPPYHTGAAHSAFATSVFGGGIFVPGLRHRTPGINEICTIIEHANVSAATFTPWIVEDIARRPDGERYMKGFDRVLVGGGTCLSLFPYPNPNDLTQSMD